MSAAHPTGRWWYLSGHNLALTDHGGDHLTVLRARGGLLRPKQVAGRQVDEIKVADDVGALRALAGTGTAQHKHHRNLRDHRPRRAIHPPDTHR